MKRCSGKCNPQNMKEAILEEIKTNRLELECQKYNVNYIHDKKIVKCISDERLIISNDILPSAQVKTGDHICLINNNENDGIYKVLNPGLDHSYCVLEAVD